MESMKIHGLFGWKSIVAGGVVEKRETLGLWETHVSTVQEDLCVLRLLNTIQMANGSQYLSCNCELLSL